MQIAKLPLVSIIVPVYNSEKFLDSCIQSLVKQSYKKIEIIIINDGSADQSKELCDYYAKNDHRITVVHKENNEGVTKARLSGFTQSKGDFVTFVDSDDFVHLQFVEIMVNAALKYNADVVGCQYFHVTKNAFFKTDKRPEEGLYGKENIRHLLKTNFLYDSKTEKSGMNPFIWTKLIKRQFVGEMLEAGINLWYEEDLVGTFKLLYSVKTMFVLSDYLYYYTQHNKQVTKIFNPNLWENANNCWIRIKDIDKESYLDKQFPKRIIMTLYDILKKCSTERYAFFENYFRMMRYSEVVKRILELECDNSFGYRSKFKLFILRKNIPFFLFVIFRFKTKYNELLAKERSMLFFQA